MFIVRKYSTLLTLLVLASMGISITIKVAIGLAPFDAFNQTFSYVLNIRVGDIVTIAQVIFVMIQLLILRKKATYHILLQIPLAAIVGQLINFWLYRVYSAFEVENYIIRLILLLVGISWVAFFLAGVMVLDLITMPLESIAMVIAREINRPFGRVRQWLDIFFIIVSLGLTFLYSLPFTIREGTVIAAVLFGPLLTIFMPIIEEKFKSWKLIETI